MKNIFLIAFGILIFQISTAQGASNTRYMNQPWKMHHIDRQFWNHNSLSPGDVDKDGLVDYLVIHEGADKVTILFNPGVGNQLYHEWEKVVISDGNNIEYGYFGDLNGDGDLDIIANCEEYYERIKGKQNTLLGVVWFENPTINP